MMNSNFLKFINIGYFDDIKVEYVNQYLRDNPSMFMIVNIDDTKSLNNSILNKLPDKRFKIRISGGLSYDKLCNYSNNKTTYEYLCNDSIYDVYECKLIMNEINKIQVGINNNWSNEEKLLYLINFIQNNIKYDSEYEFTSSKQVRSLRGLYTKKTVCVGYSLILKELCDRNNIECDLVLGYVNEEEKISNNHNPTHAWNLVKLGNNYFPIELTWSSANYRDGDFHKLENLFNTKEFIKNHIPDNREKMTDYTNLKSIDKNYIKNILETLRKNEKTSVNGFMQTRKDGSKYFSSLIDSTLFNGQRLYKYIYCDIENNFLETPHVLYSDEKIVSGRFKSYSLLKDKLNKLLIKNKDDENQFYKIKLQIRDLEFESQVFTNNINEKLFSKDNISNSLFNHNYLGGFGENSIKDQSANLKKNDFILSNINTEFKTYIRDDGSKVVVSLLKNENNYEYYVYELIDDLTHIDILKNSFSLKYNLFIYDDEFVCSQFLNCEKLNRNDYLDRIDLKKNDIIDYYEVMNFSNMEELIRNYSFSWIRNKAFSKTNRSIVTDTKLTNQIKYAYAWYETMKDKDNDSITSTFSKFNSILHLEFRNAVLLSLQNNNGVIDPIAIKLEINYVLGDNAVINKKINQLFKNNYILTVLVDMYKLQSNDILNVDVLDEINNNTRYVSSRNLYVVNSIYNNLKNRLTNICKFKK